MIAEHRQLVVGTAGHIDHGKTALVRALTGIDTDRLPAERERGITIDLGFAALDLDGLALSLIDVPGHERFIRNMLAGATGLDLAMLVVAADDSVMPQTREHLDILQLLALRAGVVVLTKCDLADPSWLALVEDDIRALVEGTFLEGTPIVRTSSTTGQGIDDLRAALRQAAATAPPREDPGLFRMAIDRTFTVAGHGTVVTGTVASGTVAVGDEIEWLPAGRRVRVRGLQRHERPADRVGRGSRAAINLAGVHHAEVRRGHELATPGYLEPSRILSVDVRAVHDLPRPIRHRGRYRIHLGTAEVSATLSLLESDELGPIDSSLAQLFLSEPVVAVHGEPFVIREESPPATVGGGRVVHPVARRIRRRDRASVDRLSELRSGDPSERLAAALAFHGPRPIAQDALCRSTGLNPRRLIETLEGLHADGRVITLSLGHAKSLPVLATTVAELETRILRSLATLHESRPRQASIPRAQLLGAMPDLHDEMVGSLIERLGSRGKLLASGRTVALAGHVPKLSHGEARLKSELAEAIRTGRFSPPDLAELAGSAGARAAVVPELLALLREEARIVAIAPGFDLDAEAEADLRRLVAGRLAEQATITMAELRDLLGTTRKYAVPTGEYLDRIGMTQRVGDLRRSGDSSALDRPNEPSTVEPA